MLCVPNDEQMQIGKGTFMKSCETCRYCGHREKGCMAVSKGTPRYLPEEGCPMYAMSARAYMERVMNAHRRIVHMEEQAARYRDMAVRSTGRMDALRSGGTSSRSKVEDGMCAFMDICRDIEGEATRLRELIAETSALIERLFDPVEREVLELRYLSGLKWEDVAEKMLYDVRQVRRIHVRALEHVQREMDLAEYQKHRPGWNPGGGQCAVSVQTGIMPS